MRVCLLLLMICLGYSQYSDAQRGRRGKWIDPITMPHVCCYFVNDNAYTKSNKERCLKDATLLVERFFRQHGIILTSDMTSSQELFIIHLYNFMADIRLGNCSGCQDFRELGIHVDQSYGEVATKLEWLGDLRREGLGTLVYSIHYKGATKVWEVYLGECPGEGYAVKCLKNDPIPSEILARQRAIGRAELKTSQLD